MTERFAVDVGGTFTDIVVLDVDTGAVCYAKASTTPDAPAEGVLNAIDKAGVSLARADFFFHGTTLGINTVLERTGASTGLITTKGFRDELEIARLNWPMYQLHWDQPPPLVPRYLRCGVTERLRADGSVVVPLDESELREAVDRLVRHGVESIAVCFIHAYAFPEHERRAGEIIAAEYPDVEFTLSHLVTQEYREYERTSTVAIDAMVKPRMAGYIDGLASRLAGEGFDGEFLVSRCDGGVMRADEVAERSVRTLISGPASGVMGAAELGRRLGLSELIAVDMGGTSFDAALITGGEPQLQPIARVEGMPMLMPSIDLATIGAGGGSIAWLDAGGALEVGPQSAGAHPGPIAFARGGTEPTFTDAALVNGLIDPDYFLGGEVKLDLEAAQAGIEAQIARPLGVSAQDAADGIVALTEAKMAGTIEEITVGKGFDPRDFSLVAYGGGGPLVASALAGYLEIPTVVVPRSPATFSAWGMLTLDIVHDFSRTQVGMLERLDARQLEEPFSELKSEAAQALEREGVPPSRRRLIRSVDMRYENQEHTLSVPAADASALEPATLRARFDEHHQSAYGYSLSEPVEVVAYRVRAVGSLEKPAHPPVPHGSSASDHARKGRRTAQHRESGGLLEWSVYERDRLEAGNRLEGPAIVEEMTTTTLVPPGHTLTIDELGNMVITRAGTGQPARQGAR